MIINGVELEDLDIFDADVAKKYEKVLNETLVKFKNVKGTSVSEVIREQCNIVFEIFNDLCGPGTDKKVFGEKVNLLTCMKAFEELVEYCNSQKASMKKMFNKYSPNRAQRRAKK